ncbi:sigma-70 family RNA polymerase sigma factor [Paenibacillus sp. MBLB4367]|uniref:sigma-70 family RNA polymerase sigma factor n=1 Tax=Paenibacillus sp. MBLB4367 TaxID=3384767 RepID=UPI0039083856
MRDIRNLVEEIIMARKSEQEEQTAFTELVTRFQDMAYGLAFSVLGDRHLAQDAAQESFVTAWKEFAQLKEPLAFSGWFKRIVLSQCNRLTRGKRVDTVILDDALAVEDEKGNPVKAAERQALTEQVRGVLMALPENERQLIMLYYISDYSYQDIANLLEIPISTIKKRLFTARKRLEEKMFGLIKEGLYEIRPSRSSSFVNLVRRLLSAGCKPEMHSDGLHIMLKSNGGYAITPDKYKVPLRIMLVAKTDSTNLRIRFALSEIIFNWDYRPDEFQWVDPATGRLTRIPKQGRIPINEFVKMEWLIENNYSSVSVNGVERYRTNGCYGHLAGQIGIGAAHGSRVTVQSFTVEGQQSTEGYEIKDPPRYEIDGGMINVLWENHDSAIEWFEQHLGWQRTGQTENWKHDENSDSEKMTPLGIPRVGVLWVKSVITQKKSEHFYIERGSGDPNLRLYFCTSELQSAHNYMKELGIRTTDIYLGPGFREYFDFWATSENIRMTACEYPEKAITGMRVTPVENYRIGVRDLMKAKEWYQEVFGLELVEEYDDQGWVLLKSRQSYYSDSCSEWWLEALPHDAVPGISDGPVRQYLHVRDLELEYERLKALGVRVSGITGNPPTRGFRLFHFYDLDGNRWNVWHY